MSAMDCYMTGDGRIRFNHLHEPFPAGVQPARPGDRRRDMRHTLQKYNIESLPAIEYPAPVNGVRPNRNPLHVGFVEPWLGGGGAMTQFIYLARELKRRGHRVSWFGHGVSEDIKADLDAAGTIRIITPETRDHVILDSGVDILHCYGGAGVVEHLRHLNVPIVGHCQGVWSIHEWQQSTFDYRVFVSRELEQLYGTLQNVPTATIPNAVPVEWLKQTVVSGDVVRAALAIEPDDFVIAWTGRIVPIKRVPFLLQVLAELIKQGLPVKLIICGESVSEQRAFWEQKLLVEPAHQLGVADAVRWLAPLSLNRMPLVYKAADLFCLPSQTEGCSLSLLEAMACGCPVVATPVGDHAVMFPRNWDGIKPANHHEWASYIRDLIRFPDVRATRAKTCRVVVSQAHNIGAFTDRMIEIYRYVIEPRKQTTDRRPQTTDHRPANALHALPS